MFCCCFSRVESMLPVSFLWCCYSYVRVLCCLSLPSFFSPSFFRMIDWLSWPLANHVDTWVIALLKGLAAVQKFTILIDVTLFKIEQVCVFTHKIAFKVTFLKNNSRIRVPAKSKEYET